MEIEKKRSKAKEIIGKWIALTIQNRFTSEKVFYKWKCLTFKQRYAIPGLIRIVANSRMTPSKALMILTRSYKRPGIDRLVELLAQICARQTQRCLKLIAGRGSLRRLADVLDAAYRSRLMDSIKIIETSTKQDRISRNMTALANMFDRHSYHMSSAFYAIKYQPLLLHTRSSVSILKLHAIVDYRRSITLSQSMADVRLQVTKVKAMNALKSMMIRKMTKMFDMLKDGAVIKGKCRRASISLSLTSLSSMMNKRYLNKLRQSMSLISIFGKRRFEIVNRLICCYDAKTLECMTVLKKILEGGRILHIAASKIEMISKMNSYRLKKISLLMVSLQARRKALGLAKFSRVLERLWSSHLTGCLISMQRRAILLLKIGRSKSILEGLISKRLKSAMAKIEVFHSQQVYRHSYTAFWDAAWSASVSKGYSRIASSRTNTRNNLDRLHNLSKGLYKLKGLSVSAKNLAFMRIKALTKIISQRSKGKYQMPVPLSCRCVLNYQQNLQYEINEQRETLNEPKSLSKKESMSHLRYVYCARINKLVQKMIKSRKTQFFNSLNRSMKIQPRSYAPVSKNSSLIKVDKFQLFNSQSSHLFYRPQTNRELSYRELSLRELSAQDDALKTTRTWSTNMTYSFNRKQIADRSERTAPLTER